MIHEYPKIEKILDEWAEYACKQREAFCNDDLNYRYYLGMGIGIEKIRWDLLELVDKEAQELEASFRPLSDIMVGS